MSRIQWLGDVSAGEDLKKQEFDYWKAQTVNWQKHHRVFNSNAAPVTTRMLAHAGVRPGGKVLDVATGTGEPALTAATHVGTAGWVLGTDFVEEMLVFAREEARRLRLDNVEFRCVDGEQLELPAGTFDAATIRWGLMFMPEPVACLARVHRVLRPGGKVAVACWASREQNPWVSIPLLILRKTLNVPAPPPGTPGPFAFADERALPSALEAAGFEDIAAELVEFVMAESDSVDGYLAYVREIAGPIGSMYATLTPEQRRLVDAEIAKAATGPDGKVRLKGVTWVAAGRK